MIKKRPPKLFHKNSFTILLTVATPSRGWVTPLPQWTHRERKKTERQKDGEKEFDLSFKTSKI